MPLLRARTMRASSSRLQSLEPCLGALSSLSCDAQAST